MMDKVPKKKTMSVNLCFFFQVRHPCCVIFLYYIF